MLKSPSSGSRQDNLACYIACYRSHPLQWQDLPGPGIPKTLRSNSDFEGKGYRSWLESGDSQAQVEAYTSSQSSQPDSITGLLRLTHSSPKLRNASSHSQSLSFAIY